MLEEMRLASVNGKLSWEDFHNMIATLIPMNLEDQLTLFLKAYVPVSTPAHEIDRFKFGK